MPKTPAHQLIEMKLGQPLADYARQKRREGASWHVVTIAIATDTGVVVTSETLRTWLFNEPDMDRVKAGAA